jgi:hypothetical protein
MLFIPNSEVSSKRWALAVLFLRQNIERGVLDATSPITMLCGKAEEVFGAPHFLCLDTTRTVVVYFWDRGFGPAAFWKMQRHIYSSSQVAGFCVCCFVVLCVVCVNLPLPSLHHAVLICERIPDPALWEQLGDVTVPIRAEKVTGTVRLYKPRRKVRAYSAHSRRLYPSAKLFLEECAPLALLRMEFGRVPDGECFLFMS